MVFREDIEDPADSERPTSLPATTLGALLRERAERQGDRTAFVFLDERGEVAERLTYLELDGYARAVAAWLRGRGKQGDRALLLFPAGLDFLKAFFGCAYANVIAIPAPPPEASRLKRTLPRLRAVAEDAEVGLLLTSSGILGLLDASPSDVPGLGMLDCQDVATLPPDFTASGESSDCTPGDLAYLQYTSGSTTRPKGVMISHHNVLHHCEYVRRACGYDEESVSVTWLPYFHDYGLVEGLLVPLLNGTPGYVMSPFAFLKRPFGWLNAISRRRATHTQAPNFAYDLCVRRVKPEQVALLDLSCLRSAGNGAEPINPRVLAGFARMFAPCGFRWQAFGPAYGLAEATLMVSCCSPPLAPRVGFFDAAALAENRVLAAPADDPTARRVTSCGPLVGATRVEIVDPGTRTRCEADRVGEIWVSDPSVALGYWRREAETEETFRAVLADTGEGPFLRTGDLGFLRDGELYITSRIKDLIIVAGTNHYPQDIEWTVERCHPAVRPNGVAAFSMPVDGEEQLVIASEIERGASSGPEETKALFDATLKAVAEGHELPIHAILLLARGSLPKTASGKIQRQACAGFFRDRETNPDVLASWVTARRPAMAPPGALSASRLGPREANP